jgi:hypothetical protein
MPAYANLLRIPQMTWVWRATVEWYIDRVNQKLGNKPVPVPLCPQVPHGLTRARTRASAVRGRRLTTWAMARPCCLLQHAHFLPPHRSIICEICCALPPVLHTPSRSVVYWFNISAAHVVCSYVMTEWGSSCWVLADMSSDLRAFRYPVFASCGNVCC